MIVRISPKYSFDSQYWWYSVRTNSLVGLIPTFYLTRLGRFQTGDVNQRFGCYATALDTDDWIDFDTPVIGVADIELTPTSALPSGTLYFSHYPMYPYSRTTRKMTEWLANANVSDTTSSTNGIIGTATERASTLDDKTIPALNFYGFKITNASSTNTKNKAILASGNHAGENPGRFTIEGVIDFLLGGSTEANNLLDWFEFYVYPCLDPQGIYGGYYRSTPQDPTKNHNREWIAETTLESVIAFKTAMIADTGGTVNLGIDFHSFGSTENSGYNMSYITDDTTDIAVAFESALKATEGSEFNLIVPDPAVGSLWNLFDTSFSPQLSLSLETGGRLSYSVAGYKSYGQNVMLAINTILNAGLFTNAPA